MSDLTFTYSGSPMLKRWDLRGPRGVIRFEIVDASGFKTASCYLHDTDPSSAVGDGFEDCDVCGGGCHDALVGKMARQLREDWERAADDNVIRLQLGLWYAEFLEGRVS